MQKTITVLPEFIMSRIDIMYLDALPANRPTTALTKEQQARIDGMYKRYITSNNADSKIELYKSVKTRKWSDGTPMLTAAAKRMMLEWLFEMQRTKELTIDKLARKYKEALNLPEAYRILIDCIYDFH